MPYGWSRSARRDGLRLVGADPLSAPAQARPRRGHCPGARASARRRSGPAPATARARRPGRTSTMPRGPRAHETGPGAQQLVGHGGRSGPASTRPSGIRRPRRLGLQRPPQCVPGPRVTRPPGGIPIACHRSGSGSASQPRSSVSKASGRCSSGNVRRRRSAASGRGRPRTVPPRERSAAAHRCPAPPAGAASGPGSACACAVRTAGRRAAARCARASDEFQCRVGDRRDPHGALVDLRRLVVGPARRGPARQQLPHLAGPVPDELPLGKHGSWKPSV